MNTGSSGIDYATAHAALERMAAANGFQELSDALDHFVEGVGLTSFVLIQVLSLVACRLNCVHNLDGSLDGRRLITVPLVAQLAANPIPVRFADGDVPQMEAGVGAGSLHGSSVCVLLVSGSPDRVLDEIGLMGLCSLAVNQIADTCHRISQTSCPLTVRELECLRFAAAGASAKETARHLGISHRTVEEYSVRCRKRTSTDTTLAAAAQALRRGWISAADISRCEALLNRQCAAG